VCHSHTYRTVCRQHIPCLCVTATSTEQSAGNIFPVCVSQPHVQNSLQATYSLFVCHSHKYRTVCSQSVPCRAIEHEAGIQCPCDGPLLELDASNDCWRELNMLQDSNCLRIAWSYCSFTLWKAVSDVDWYRGYRATTPCAPRPWNSRPVCAAI
jgi:hypothetical protein